MRLQLQKRKKMACRKLSLWVMTVVTVILLAGPAWAARDIHVVVKAVLASQGSQYFDPRLSDLVEELKSVFKYSSYELLTEDKVNLAMKETGTVSLPGKRVLKITPVQISGNRVELELVIFKNQKEIFRTVSQLLNRSSIIVGGPEYKDGYLLFNIFAAF
jgi:hypothetical protein